MVNSKGPNFIIHNNGDGNKAPGDGHATNSEFRGVTESKLTYIPPFIYLFQTDSPSRLDSHAPYSPHSIHTLHTVHARFTRSTHSTLFQSSDALSPPSLSSADLPVHPEQVLPFPRGVARDALRPGYRHVVSWLHLGGDAHRRAPVQWIQRGTRLRRAESHLFPNMLM